jgi:hypothetical protein
MLTMDPATGSSTTRVTRQAAAAAPQQLTAKESAWDQVVISRDHGDGAAVAGDTATGVGAGAGRGNGNGIGIGDGGGIAAAPALPAPPAPRRSLARPARLLKPARDRDVVPDKLFVARVTVDTDGDVVGAHLVHFAPTRASELAAAAVWQFHYEPALDDDGRPITSTFEQPFQIW